MRKLVMAYEQVVKTKHDGRHRRPVMLPLLHKLSGRTACVLMAVVLLLTQGCSNDLVPVNATLRINPDSHSITVTELRDSNDQCLFYTDNYVDIPVLLQLDTADGSPIGDAQISVYADFAANTFPGFPVLSLYDDLNGNGVVDSPIELISGADDAIAQVSTDTWSGSRTLLLRINLSCAFRGELFAFSGGVSGRASVEVVANPSDDTDPSTRNQIVLTKPEY